MCYERPIWFEIKKTLKEFSLLNKKIIHAIQRIFRFYKLFIYLSKNLFIN